MSHRIFSLNVFPQKYLLFTKRKITIMEETGRHSLNQEIEMNLTSNQTYPDMHSKNVQPESNHQEPPDKHILSHILQNNWSVLFKTVEVIKDKKKKKRLRNHYRLKVTKVTGKLNAM